MKEVPLVWVVRTGIVVLLMSLSDHPSVTTPLSITVGVVPSGSWKDLSGVETTNGMALPRYNEIHTHTLSLRKNLRNFSIEFVPFDCLIHLIDRGSNGGINTVMINVTLPGLKQE